MSIKKRLLKSSLKRLFADNLTPEKLASDKQGQSDPGVPQDAVHLGAERLAEKLSAIMRRQSQLESLLSQDVLLHKMLMSVQAWQKNRIAGTYRRLLTHEAFGQATRFVLEEAYAGPDHDALIGDIERVVPHVVRLFPEPLVKTAVDILALNTLTLALDIELSQSLLDHKVLPEAVNTAIYEQAYCALDNFSKRYEQLTLMRALGDSVEHYLGSQWVYAAFKVTKLPAKALGLQALVNFMQRGFEAIHQLPIPATDLVNLIVDTEQGYVDRLRSGERNIFSPGCQAAQKQSQAILNRLTAKAEVDPVAV